MWSFVLLKGYFLFRCFLFLFSLQLFRRSPPFRFLSSRQHGREYVTPASPNKPSPSSTFITISSADVQVTQGISQNTSSSVVSLVDDMLQSRRMTIEDLIEASDVQGAPASNGSHRNNNAADFPSELDIFYGKHMLFKVEVADGNLIHNWRSYDVKRISDDGDMTKRFMVPHNIKAYFVYCITKVEGVDSSKPAVNQKATDVISSKVAGKRSAEKGVSELMAYELDGDESATKSVKLKSVKLEPKY
ncbi:transmembrane protein, putative [Medicago truncatula]|uniref:Transmembrane protein, putative n=1 Tax=Medicago truncatula TaxID=3880 RepID=A0A072V636_MEDTR|nr:transmembrane protein, putative [Medicago truncatula]